MSRYELTKAKYLLDPERAQLVETLEKYAQTNLRDTTLLHLALHTGARACELLALGPASLDPHEQTVFIKANKGSNNREIPLPPWLYERLQALPVIHNRFFPISYVRFYQIWCDWRPVKKKLHALRHTFAIGLYRKTKDIKLIQVALGHRSWGNTMIYADYQYKTAELRRAMLG